MRWLLLALCLLVTARAEASPLFELLGATSGQGGFNARATAPSAASTYFNPALLPRARRGLDLGTYFLHDDIAVGLMPRSRENDLALEGRGRYGVEGQLSLPSQWLAQGCRASSGDCATNLPARPRGAAGSSQQTRPYATLGLVIPIFDQYLTGGIYALVPLESFTRADSFFVDEREQYFSNSLHPELYSDRLDAISMALGFGSQLTERLSIGVSLTLSLENRAGATTYVSDSNNLQDSLQLSSDVDVSGSLSPHGAVHYQGERASLSLTLHSPQEFAIETRTTTQLPLGSLQRADRLAVHDWMPWRLGVAGQVDLVKTSSATWSLVGTLVWARWSQYLNRQGERARVDFAWRDTFTPTLGLRNVARERWRSLLDITYARSPVPDQVGRDNYVDNDRLGIVLGSEYELPVNRKVDIRIGFTAQLHVLRERIVHKLDPTTMPPVYPQLVADEWRDDDTDPASGEVYTQAAGLQTNNPGWPGFSSRGVLLGGGLYVSLSY
jgi:long-chain fatty acid transport protein